MKQDDNIKKFFQKRLQETLLTEDGWNVPSDDIWDRAKVHFPKKRKRRIPFTFIFFGFIGLGMISYYGVRYFNSTELVPMAEKEMKKFDNQSTEIKGYDDVLKLNQEANSQTLVGPQKKKDVSKIIEKVEPVITKTGNVENWTGHSANEMEKENEFLDNKNIDVNSSVSVQFSKNQFIANPGDEKLTDKVEDEVMKMPKVELLPTSSAKVEKEREATASFELLELQKMPKWNRWEIGITYAPFVISPRYLVQLDEDEDPNLTQSIDLSYTNFNIPISRRIGTRFSLTSGLSWSEIDIDLDITQKVIYQMGSTDETLRNFIEENSVGGSITLDKESSDIAFRFSDEANLVDGDEIEVRASLPLSLRAVQIPFLLNFHIPRGKFEWLLHAGFSLDYFEASVSAVDFAVFKQGNLISEGVEFNPLTESDFALSVYAGGGLKYHINDRMNIGVNTKIDLSIIPLARYEVGVFYKF